MFNHPMSRVSTHVVALTLVLVLAVVLTACGRGVDPGLAELTTQLLAATPEDQREALSADLAALEALDRQEKLGDAERRGLLDLFRSAARNGALDDDERALLTSLTRDLVAGAGRVAHSPET